MPQNVTMWALVLGAVLLLIAILGGSFKIFGSEISGQAGKLGRAVSFVLSVVFISVGLIGSSDKPSPQPSPSPIQPAPQPVNPSPKTTAPRQINLSGVWHDVNYPGNGVRIVQEGDSFEFSGWGVTLDGIRFQTSGSGTLVGQSVTHSYLTSYASGVSSSGSCFGTVSSDGNRMTVTCTDSFFGTLIISSIRQ